MNKPLVEKRRRERINKYLYELHALLTESGNAIPAAKLEKADILEMAVNHIRNIKRQLNTTNTGEYYIIPADSLIQLCGPIPNVFPPLLLGVVPYARSQQPIQPFQPREKLQVRIPSPASSVSSNNSDHMSPPAGFVSGYPAVYPNRPAMSKTSPSSYQGTVVPVHGGGFAVVFQNGQTIIPSESSKAMPTSRQQPSMWRPW